MSDAVSVRRLGPGDEAVLARLVRDGPRYEEADDVAQQEAATAVPLAPADAAVFLADDHTHLLVAFRVDEPSGGEPVGFVVVNELLHRHTFARMFLVYEIGVVDDHRREGVGRTLLDAVRALAIERGVPEGFVLTNESNAAAMALYEAAGGTRPSLDVAEWDFDYLPSPSSPSSPF
jgi:ribosomal protein S18 acetylase RimI-like enzyme